MRTVAVHPLLQSGLRGGLMHPRFAALIALSGAAAHVGMATTAAAGVFLTALALLMAGLCLPCTVGLWRSGGKTAASALMGMSLAMVVVHAVLLLGGGGMGGHGGAAPATRMPMTAWMVAPMVLDYAAAVLAAGWLMRLRKAAHRGAGRR